MNTAPTTPPPLYPDAANVRARDDPEPDAAAPVKRARSEATRFTFEHGEFAGKTVRTAPTDPPIASASDIIMAINDCDRKAALHAWEYQKKQPWATFELSSGSVGHWKFDGRNESAGLTARQVVKLVNNLPGPKAAAFRDKCADVFVRYLGGDQSLVAEIAQNRATATAIKRTCSEATRFTFQHGEFAGRTVRTAPTDPPIASASDIIMAINDCDRKTAMSAWDYQKKQHWAVSEYRSDSVRHWKFDGRNESVGLTARQVVKLVNTLPGSDASSFREVCADELVYHLGGSGSEIAGICRMRPGHCFGDFQTSIRPRTKKQTEREVQRRLAAREGGEMEVPTLDGFVDVLTQNDVVEVKNVKQWKHAYGQVVLYAEHFPDRQPRVHFFGEAPDSFCQYAKNRLESRGVRVTFETSW